MTRLGCTDRNWLAKQATGFLSVKWQQLALSHFGADNNPDVIVNQNDGANQVNRAVKVIYNMTQEI